MKQKVKRHRYKDYQIGDIVNNVKLLAPDVTTGNSKNWSALTLYYNAIILTRPASIKSSKTKQCFSCYLKSRKMAGIWTPSYASWRCMKQRVKSYDKKKWYSDIKIDPRWEKFENFYSDMGDRPVKMSLDRINPFGDYCKENCRWATQSQQIKNSRKAWLKNANIR